MSTMEKVGGVLRNFIEKMKKHVNFIYLKIRCYSIFIQMAALSVKLIYQAASDE